MWEHPEWSKQLHFHGNNTGFAANWTVTPLYAAPPQPLDVQEQRDRAVASQAKLVALEEAAQMLERQHTWLTKVAAANLVRGLYGSAGAVEATPSARDCDSTTDAALAHRWEQKFYDARAALNRGVLTRSRLREALEGVRGTLAETLRPVLECRPQQRPHNLIVKVVEMEAVIAGIDSALSGTEERDHD
jgi:hypothetical protein